MGKYNELISDDSTWLSTTPTTTAMSLPFHITEAGHFTAYSGYKVKRDKHESFLLLLTEKGNGTINTNGSSFILTEGKACVINCREPHEYFCSDEWEFYWMHFDGASLPAIYSLLYPNGCTSLDVSELTDFSAQLRTIISHINLIDVESTFDTSCRLHSLLSILITSALETEKNGIHHGNEGDIDTVIRYIKENYKRQISIDDMTDTIHMSKFHFIRVFRRVMGVTPYSYLTNYRINISKELLRSTDMTISDIAGSCGFLDAGNFIAQFKKRTGLRPLQYRRDFT